jgi:hypothetical protein
MIKFQDLRPIRYSDRYKKFQGGEQFTNDTFSNLTLLSSEDALSEIISYRSKKSFDKEENNKIRSDFLDQLALKDRTDIVGDFTEYIQSLPQPYRPSDKLIEYHEKILLQLG